MAAAATAVVENEHAAVAVSPTSRSRCCLAACFGCCCCRRCFRRRRCRQVRRPRQSPSISPPPSPSYAPAAPFELRQSAAVIRASSSHHDASPPPSPLHRQLAAHSAITSTVEHLSVPNAHGGGSGGGSRKASVSGESLGSRRRLGGAHHSAPYLCALSVASSSSRPSLGGGDGSELNAHAPHSSTAALRKKSASDLSVVLGILQHGAAYAKRAASTSALQANVHHNRRSTRRRGAHAYHNHHFEHISRRFIAQEMKHGECRQRRYHEKNVCWGEIFCFDASTRKPIDCKLDFHDKNPCFLFVNRSVCVNGGRIARALYVIKKKLGKRRKNLFWFSARRSARSRPSARAQRRRWRR